MSETSRERPNLSPVSDATEQVGAAAEQARQCVGCSGAVSGARCDQCGVPAAPGGYRVERIIGQGAHSRVYQAVKDGQRVALKELLFALVPERSQLDAFERETALLRQLRHPRIPRFVGSFSEGEGIHRRLYLAQELVPGASLLQALDSHRFSEEEARQIAREVLEVLVYLHGLSPRVIHRDIKPANLMRRPDGTLALVDFGAARDLQRGVTHGATLVGTFGYMPPEQLGGTVDETADLYALGATLIHLLSRKPPDELLRHDLDLDFRDALNVSPRTAKFIARLVARKREERFRTAREALAALDAVEVVPSRPASSGPSLKVWTAIGVAALGAVLFAVSSRTATSVPNAPLPPPAVAAPQTVAPPVAVPAAPPRVAPPPPKPTRPATTRPAIEVAAVETLDGPRVDRGLLRDDRNFALGAEVAPSLEGCDTPPTVVLEKAELKVDGPGGLADAKSRLYLGVKLSNKGGGRACEAVELSLRSTDGAVVSRVTRISSDRPGMEVFRTVDFTFPRTLKELDVCVGGKCAVRLGLTSGGFKLR